MTKRNYTHIQKLLPAIQAMAAEGMTQREIAEHFGFKDKFVVKHALTRARRKAITIPKARGRKPAKTLQEYKYKRKMSYCGIFSCSQKGCEAEIKISSYLSSSNGTVTLQKSLPFPREVFLNYRLTPGKLDTTGYL